MWLSFLFIALKLNKNFYKISFFALSLIFLTTSFFIKETSVIICGLLTICLFIFIKNREFFQKTNIYLLSISLAVSLICSCLVIFMVMKYRQGYASNYSFYNDNLSNSIKSLWTWMSTYSINNLYGYIPIFLFFTIAIKYKRDTIYNIHISYHFALLVNMLLLSYGFLLILIPWKPLGIKYILPSIFFFSFAVGYALSLLARWIKERYKNKGFLVYILLIIYMPFYLSSKEESDHEKIYWIELGNYGVSIVDALAESIAEDFFSKNKPNQSVFVEYKGFEHGILYEKLQLMRILSLEKGINLANSAWSQILNYNMPGAELSSFKKYKNKKFLYISDKQKDLKIRNFDYLYKRCKKEEKHIFIENSCYKPENKYFSYHSRNFESFSLCKYISVSIDECKQKL
jgi:uncharacterized membrane protein YecN with MAPEG domain